MNATLKSALFALTLSIAAPAWCWEEGDEQKCPAHGRYLNPYGFQLDIPQGFKGCPNSPIGMSDHGLFILLGASAPRTIEAYAAYNSLEYGSASDDADADIEFMQHEEDREAVVVQLREKGSLGGLPAEHVVLRYRLKSDHSEHVYDAVWALRSVHNGKNEAPSHEYSVSLSTTSDHYMQDRAVLRQVLRSWQRIAAVDWD